MPLGVAVDGAFVYGVDTGNNRVQKFNTAGIFFGEWGTEGSGDGQFRGPTGLAIDSGWVYVVDTGNNRVKKFNTAGIFFGEWDTEGSGEGK